MSDQAAGAGTNAVAAEELYATWSRHTHPVVPRSPVAFEDLPSLQVFYRAGFTAAPARQLVAFDKFTVRVRDIGDATESALTEACYAALDVTDGFRRGESLTPAAALAARRWIVPQRQGSQVRLQLVEIEPVGTTRYAYDGGGQLASVTIADELGVRTFGPER